MSALLLPRSLNNTKTLAPSRSFHDISISAPETLSLSPSFPALSLSVGSSSCLSSSSLFNPVRRKASRSHLVYCTQVGPPTRDLIDLSTVKKVEEWMDWAFDSLREEIIDKVRIDYWAARDLLCKAQCSEKRVDDEETPRHHEIETAVWAIKKLADWSKEKLVELSEAPTKSKLEELIERKWQIIEELLGSRSYCELIALDLPKTEKRIGKEEDFEKGGEEEVRELEAPGKLEDETTNAVTERKLQSWMEEAVALLNEEMEDKIDKDYKIAEDLLWEAYHAANSYEEGYDWEEHRGSIYINISENAIKKLADWSARKLKELSELPKKSKLHEFRERKVQILKELPETMKPHKLKEQNTTSIQRVDVTEATDDVYLDCLKDQETVCTKITGEAYEVAKNISDEAEEASFFGNLSEKQKKAIKKLVDDWSDPHQ